MRITEGMIIVTQEVSGKKWTANERFTFETAMETKEEPVGFLNSWPIPPKKALPVWTEEFVYKVLEMDFVLLKGCGAVMPDRTWEVRHHDSIGFIERPSYKKFV